MNLHAKQVLIPAKDGHGNDKKVGISNEVDGIIRLTNAENAYITKEDLLKALSILFPVKGKHGGTF